MPFTKSLLLAATALFATTAMADCPAAGSVVCQTSDGSPLTSQCQLVASAASSGAVTGCGQAYGSGCNSEGCVDNACTAVVCQDDGAEPHCLSDANLSCEGTYLQMIIDQCASDDGKVGGYVHVPDADGSGNYLNFEFTTC